eukprot:1627634-Rhodomonas_salina.3
MPGTDKAYGNAGGGFPDLSPSGGDKLLTKVRSAMVLGGTYAMSGTDAARSTARYLWTSTSRRSTSSTCLWARQGRCVEPLTREL